jgi:Ca2+-binding RTX toxin-like protein
LLAEVTDTKDGQPAAIPERVVAQARFEYQMALLVAQEFKTTAKALLPAAINIVLGKSDGAPRLDNQFDVVGRETTTLVTAMVADSQWHHGANVDVFIEDQPLVRGTIRKAAAGVYWDTGALMPNNNYTQNDFGDTHSIVLLIDSLSVQHLLQTLAPTATQADIETLFKAASVVKAESTTGTQGRAEGDVLETLLDSLLRVFTHDDPELRKGKAKNGNGLLTGGTWADESLRETFYDKLKALGDSPAFKEAKGKLTLTLPGRDLATAARPTSPPSSPCTPARRFALKAVPGQESTLEAALKAQWTAEYTAWKADQDLTPEQRANHEGTYTDRYLADRAAFLARLAQARLANTGEGQALRATTLDTALRNFKDEASGLSLQEVHALTGAAAGARVVFGGDGNDSVVGETGDDAFYGGAGSDQLDGGAGDDTLEGNADADELRGGAGRDTLLGGQGNDRLEGGDNNDTLVGGPGDDTLMGGDGEDTYVINDGDGHDHVVDSGRNFIKHNGELVSGVFIKGETGTSYTFVGDKGWRMTFSSPGVLTFNATTSLTFDNYSSAEAFASSEFGIRLQKLPPVSIGGTPAPEEMTGSFDDEVFEGGDGREIIDASYGNDSVWAETRITDPAALNVSLHESGSGQPGSWLQGGGGDDLIVGSHGNDVLLGGPGGDVIYGGSGDDVLHATSWSVPGIPIEYSYLATEVERLTFKLDWRLEPGINAFFRSLWPSRGASHASKAYWDLFPGWNIPGKHFLYGGSGNDFVSGGEVADVLAGDEGDDTLAGDGGDDILLGGDGDDRLTGELHGYAPDLWEVIDGGIRDP